MQEPGRKAQEHRAVRQTITSIPFTAQEPELICLIIQKLCMNPDERTVASVATLRLGFR